MPAKVRFLPAILLATAACLFPTNPVLWSWPLLEDPATSAIKLNSVGVGYMSRFLYREAAAEFRNALATDPSFDLARINLGIALLYNQELDAAQHVFEEALARDPVNPYANFSLGLVLKNKGLADQSEVHFKRVTDVDQECAAAFYNLGAIHARQGKVIEAEAALRHALELEPSHTAALYNLGSLLVKLGRIREGYEILDRFRALQRGAEISSGMGSGPQYGKAGKYAVARDSRSQTPQN